MAADLERVAGTSLAAFQAQTQDKPLVIFYPRHRSRQALVALLLQIYADNLIYHRLDDRETHLAAWLEELAHSQTMPQGFGASLRAALQGRAEPEELAVALANDLGVTFAERFTVLLDNLDHLCADEPMMRFFRALADCLPRHVQVAINARLLDLEPWNSLVLSGKAAVVGSEKALDGGIYGDDPKHGQLEVFALSGGHVYADGQPVTSWEGGLPRHLFYYFVDHTMVTRDEIFAIFWPKMSVKEATNVFHVTKRKISERLGHELTNYSGGFYVPSPRLSVHYDVRHFEQAVDQAAQTEQDAPALWSRAVQLYRSDYLPYIDMPWVRERREQLRSKYAQALIGLGRYHRGRNESELALGYLLRALREKPDWEDVHQDVMSIYIQEGRREDAAAQYHLLEQTLDKMFHIKPGKETRRFQDMIRAM